MPCALLSACSALLLDRSFGTPRIGMTFRLAAHGNQLGQMWLVSAQTTASLFGAVVGAVLMRAFTDLSPLLALLIGALVGWLIAALTLGSVAARADRHLHRMGGPRRFRRRGR